MMTSANTDKLDSNHRQVIKSKTGMTRIGLAFLAICIVLGGVVSISIWYQLERPLWEIEKALKSDRPAVALKLVNQFLRDHPDDSRAQPMKARVLIAMGQSAEALRIFYRYGASEAVDLHAWAKAHLLREEWSDALPVLDQLLLLNSRDAEALHGITACRSFLGKNREAIQSAERLLEIPGQQSRALLQLGTLHRRLGNSQMAVQMWLRILQSDPEASSLEVSSAVFFSELGRELLKTGEPKRAIDMLRRSLSTVDNAETLNSLGDALQSAGNEAEAVSTWKRAVELDPELYAPRESLAQWCFRNGEYDQARSWLTPVLQKPKLSSSTAYLMQRIFQAEGDRESADHWTLKTDQLRRAEKLQAAVDHVLIESPDSVWSRCILAYRFAESGNWHQAEVLSQELPAESQNEPFVQALIKCIRDHGSLPSLELLGVLQF